MPSAPGPSTLEFFTPQEFCFLTAVVRRLLPDDGFGPSGVDAGVPAYIDKQLSGSLGAAPSTVREASFSQAFRAGLDAMQRWTEDRSGRCFESLSRVQQDEVLRFLEGATEPLLGGVCARDFFTTLLNLAKVGYLQSPIVIAALAANRTTQED